MHFEESINVAKSPEEIWEFFEDVNNLPRWDRGVARVEVTSGREVHPDGVGFAFDTIGHGERGRMSYVITELSRYHSSTTVTHSGYFKEARWRFVLEPIETGTKVVCEVIFTLRLRYLLLAPVLLAASGRGAIRKDLENLKHVVEGE